MRPQGRAAAPPQHGHKVGTKGAKKVQIGSFAGGCAASLKKVGLFFFFQALQVLLPQQSPCWHLSAPKSQHCWIRIPDQWDEIVGGQAELWGSSRGSPSPAEPWAALAVSCHFFLPVIYLIFPAAASGRVAMGTQQQPRLSRRRAPGARHVGRMRPRHPWVPPPRASAPSQGPPGPFPNLSPALAAQGMQPGGSWWCQPTGVPPE